MLEFLTFLSARFHAEVNQAAAEIARAAMYDPLVDISAALEEEIDAIDYATLTWGVVQAPGGYLVATPDGWHPSNPRP